MIIYLRFYIFSCKMHMKHRGAKLNKYVNILGLLYCNNKLRYECYVCSSWLLFFYFASVLRSASIVIECKICSSDSSKKMIYMKIHFASKLLNTQFEVCKRRAIESSFLQILLSCHALTSQGGNLFFATPKVLASSILSIVLALFLTLCNARRLWK